MGNRPNLDGMRVVSVVVLSLVLLGVGFLVGYCFGVQSSRTQELVTEVQTQPQEASPSAGGVPQPQEASPSGKIAFIRGGEAWVLDMGTRRERRLLEEGTATVGGNFVWSPDGRYLAWQPVFHGAPALFLYVWDSQKDGLLEFSVRFDEVSYQYSELLDYIWSPDNTEVVLLRRNTLVGGWEEYSIERYSFPLFRRLENVISREQEIVKIVWKKPGSIVFLGEEGISSVQVDGGAPLKIVEKGAVVGREIFGFGLSPDGETIAFIRGGGIELVNISTLEISSTNADFRSSFRDVLWSPDGKRLVSFQWGYMADRDIIMLTLGDRQPLTLVIYLPEDTTYSWAPDSKMVVYSTVEPTTKEQQVRVISLNNRKRSTLLDNASRPVWSPK